MPSQQHAEALTPRRPPGVPPASPPRHPIVFGLRERFAIRSSRQVPQPRLEDPAGISRIRRPPQEPVAFPAHLDQHDQQLTRNPVANLDAHDSHRMAAVSGPGRRGIQSASPQSAADNGHGMPPSPVIQGMDQLIHEPRGFQVELPAQKRLVLAVGADGLGRVSLRDPHLHNQTARAFAQRVGLCRGQRRDEGIAEAGSLHQGRGGALQCFQSQQTVTLPVSHHPLVIPVRQKLGTLDQVLDVIHREHRWRGARH